MVVFSKPTKKKPIPDPIVRVSPTLATITALWVFSGSGDGGGESD